MTTHQENEMSDMPRTSRDALKSQGEIVRKSYENKIARLERELAALRADVDRYRWLREQHCDLDAAIDAAMKKEWGK